jgi:hypothetical protein
MRKRRSVAGESAITCPDVVAARDILAARHSHQPIAHMDDRFTRLVAMRRDILSCDVRDKFLVAIDIFVEDDTVFAPLAGWPKSTGAQKQPEFKRHVEARQPGLGVKLGTRDIVNREIAGLDDLGYSLEPVFATIHQLKGATRYEATIDNRKDDGIENRLVPGIERAIDKDASFRVRLGQVIAQVPRRRRRKARKMSRVEMLPPGTAGRTLRRSRGTDARIRPLCRSDLSLVLPLPLRFFIVTPCD